MNPMPRHAALLLLLVSAAVVAQQPALQPTTAAEAPKSDTSYIDAQGTAHVTRVVPVPPTSARSATRFWAAPGAGPGPAGVAGAAPSRTDAYTAGAAWPGARSAPTIVDGQDRRSSGAHRHARRYARSQSRQGAVEPAWRRLQLRFRSYHGVDSDCRLHERSKSWRCFTGWLPSIPFRRRWTIRWPSTRSC